MDSEEELITVIKHLRRGRGLAVNAGSIGITLATATEARERAVMADYLAQFIQRFSDVVDTIMAMPVLKRAAREEGAAAQEISDFAKAVMALDGTDHYASLTRDVATVLTTRAREKTLPAFYVFIRRFEVARSEQAARRADRLRMQTVELEKMFAEVEDIGRMIHLISLNASVEAARAGGESGRSFKVIADEIRALAAKSAQLIDTTRNAMRDGGDTDG
ncbi:MAG: methyl-accepting chemotaxis protein [Pseudomonadota bacterium]